MASEYTSHYNLDKYVAADKPNLRDQYNSAMDKIDAQMYANATGVVTAQATANNADAAIKAEVTRATNAEEELESNLEKQISDTADSITAGYKAADTKLQTNVDNEVTRATNAEDELRHTQSDQETLINNNAQNLASEITRAKAAESTKAPINHATSATNYGVGSATNYGHVKLVDTVDISTKDSAITSSAVANLFNFTSKMVEPTNIGGGEIDTARTNLSLAFNSDNSMFKFYGRLRIQNLTSSTVNLLKAQIVDERFTSSYNLADSIPVQVWDTGSGTLLPPGGWGVNIKIDNGSLTLECGNLDDKIIGANRAAIFYFSSCIYINANFGD